MFLIKEKEKKEQKASQQSIQPNNDNNNKNQRDVRGLIFETIAKYQQMIDESSSEVERQVLQTTINTLYKKLDELETGEVTNDISVVSAPKKETEVRIVRKKDEKRIKALREIFDFYSKQQLAGGKPGTFDRLERQFNTLNLGKFSVILKNYKIKIDHMVRKELV